MSNILLDEELCMALSGLFVGTAPDYERIASVAKRYPVDFVEKTLFRYVAPACNYNTLCVEPTVIYLFDREQLLKRIKCIEKRRKTKWGKIYYSLFSLYLRYKFKPGWEVLRQLVP